MDSHIYTGAGTGAQFNPFRYRGYYYDSDLGFYYLNSRYYDANTGRFINVDDHSVITATPDALTDKNLYAYCDNNPVMRADNGGEFWHILVGAAVGAIVNSVAQIVIAPKPRAWGHFCTLAKTAKCLFTNVFFCDII